MAPVTGHRLSYERDVCKPSGKGIAQATAREGYAMSGEIIGLAILLLGVVLLVAKLIRMR